MEGPTKQNTQEQIPETFPIVEDTGTYHFSLESEEEPAPREEEIIHFIQNGNEHGEEKIENYLLSKRIGRYLYLFYLKKGGWKGYSLSWKTKEYEYTRTGLEDDETKLLLKTINSFLISLYPKMEGTREPIIASSEPVNWSVKDLEQCKEEVLRSPRCQISREELDEKYKGSKIFYLYEEIFGAPFGNGKIWAPKGAEARNRYYQMMARRHLPEGEVEQDDFGDLIINHKKNNPTREIKDR